MDLLRKIWRPKRVDVFVDIDETLLYPRGPFVMGDLSYQFAHGALEFLVALDKMPNVWIHFYSLGHVQRSMELVSRLDSIARERFGHALSKLGVVTDIPPKAKILEGRVEGLCMERAILVDDTKANARIGEERNLLKVYERIYNEHEVITDVAKVYEMRRKNNLVRALGIILKCMKDSDGWRKKLTLVEAMEKLYLESKTNSREIYELGLKEMRKVDPSFYLVEDDSTPRKPWTE